MDSIRLPSAMPPPSAVDASPRMAETAVREDGPRKLDPAVSLDISPDADRARKADTERRGFERDVDSKAVVYRVTDTLSGDVIIQIPNEIVVKARTYGREQNPPVGERVERRV